MDVQTTDVVVESCNISFLTLFITLNASDGVCFSASGGSSDLFLFRSGNQADTAGYGGMPDALIRCGSGVNGTPCAGNLALKLAKENLDFTGALTDWTRSEDIYLKSNRVIIDADTFHLGNISNGQETFTENTAVTIKGYEVNIDGEHIVMRTGK